MKRMQKKRSPRSLTESALRIIAVLSITTFGLFYSIKAAEGDELWQKAVAIASANEHLVPGSIHQIDKMFDEKGELKETSEIYLAVEKGTKRRLSIKLLKATTNNRDVTNKVRKDVEKQLNNTEEDELYQTFPFMASVQKNTHYRREESRRVIERKNCVSYAFTYGDEEETWQGTAWLEEKSGIPVETEASLTSVPYEEEGIKVFEVVLTASYEYAENGEWYPKSLMVDARIEGIKKSTKAMTGRVTTMYRFSNYWAYE